MVTFILHVCLYFGANGKSKKKSELKNKLSITFFCQLLCYYVLETKHREYTYLRNSRFEKEDQDISPPIITSFANKVNFRKYII